MWGNKTTVINCLEQLFNDVVKLRYLFYILIYKIIIWLCSKTYYMALDTPTMEQYRILEYPLKKKRKFHLDTIGICFGCLGICHINYFTMSVH